MKTSIVLPALLGVAGSTDRGTRRKNPKRTGELSEAALLLKAKRLGFLVAKPWGDSERYDFILDSGSRLWRVQLKCTEVMRSRGYEVQPIYNVYGKGKATYSAEQIDALVVHIPPCNVWYVLPVGVWGRQRICGSIRTWSARRRGGSTIARLGTCCGRRRRFEGRPRAEVSDGSGLPLLAKAARSGAPPFFPSLDLLLRASFPIRLRC